MKHGTSREEDSKGRMRYRTSWKDEGAGSMGTKVFIVKKDDEWHVQWDDEFNSADGKLSLPVDTFLLRALTMENVPEKAYKEILAQVVMSRL